MSTHQGWVALLIALSVLSFPKLTNESIIVHPIKPATPPQPDNLSLWIDKLAQVEKCPVEGIIDSNHKKSYGCLCFQKETFIRQARLYLLPDATDEEILAKIKDCEFQKKLAYEMIKHDKNKIYHWRLSVKKIGKPW